MTRLKKELTKEGILFETDEIEVMLHGKVDACSKLVSITDKFLITVVYSNVLDPILHLYDRRSWEYVGEQYLLPDRTFGGGRTWGSYLV